MRIDFNGLMVGFVGCVQHWEMAKKDADRALFLSPADCICWLIKGKAHGAMLQ